MHGERWVHPTFWSGLHLLGLGFKNVQRTSEGAMHAEGTLRAVVASYCQMQRLKALMQTDYTGRVKMKRRTIMTLIALLALALLAVACGGMAAEQSSAIERTDAEEAPAQPEFYSEGDFAMAGSAPVPAATMVPAAEIAAVDSAGNPATQVQPNQQRLIIRNADMTIVATDTEVALAQIAQMADNGGGWVVSSNVYQSSETSKTGYIQIRVPSAGFQSVLDAIAGLAVRVESLSTSGQDVTEEYVDLSSQLVNLEATAARVRGFLDDAVRVEDALAVNAELSRLEGEIAVIKGRMQYLEQSSAFSSITVNVTPDELAQPIEVAGWQPSGVAKQAIETLARALQTLANLLIWFVIVALPILVIILIPFLLVLWLIRRLRRREHLARRSEE